MGQQVQAPGGAVVRVRTAPALIRFLPTFRLTRSAASTIVCHAHFSHVGTVDFFVLYPRRHSATSPAGIARYGIASTRPAHECELCVIVKGGCDMQTEDYRHVG